MNVLKTLKYSDLRQIVKKTKSILNFFFFFKIQIKYNYNGPFYLHYEDNLSTERRVIEDEDSYAKIISEVLKQSFKTNSELSLKVIFQPLLMPDYSSYSALNYSPLKNCKIIYFFFIFQHFSSKVEMRVCEICYNTSMVPYDPLNKGKSFICENCKRFVIGPDYSQNLPIKPVSSFYSPTRQLSLKQRYLSYEP